MPVLSDLLPDDFTWYGSELKEAANSLFGTAVEQSLVKMAGSEEAAVDCSYAYFNDDTLAEMEADKSVTVPEEHRAEVIKSARTHITQVISLAAACKRLDEGSFESHEAAAIMSVLKRVHRKEIKKMIRWKANAWVDSLMACATADDEESGADSDSDDESDDDDEDGNNSDDSDLSTDLKKRLEPEEEEESDEEEEVDEEDSAAEENEDALAEMRKEAKGLKRGPAGPSSPSKKPKKMA